MECIPTWFLRPFLPIMVWMALGIGAVRVSNAAEPAKVEGPASFIARFVRPARGRVGQSPKDDLQRAAGLVNSNCDAWTSQQEKNACVVFRGAAKVPFGCNERFGIK